MHCAGDDSFQALLTLPASAEHLRAVHLDLADWLQQASAAAQAAAGGRSPPGAAAAALQTLACLLKEACDDALVLRYARCVPLLGTIAWLADEAAHLVRIGLSGGADAPLHESLVTGVSELVCVFGVGPYSTGAAADALRASPALPAAAATLLRMAAKGCESIAAAQKAAFHCLSAAMKSPCITATAARELARAVAVALHSDSEVERACACRALLSAGATNANRQLSLPLIALLAERGVAAGLVSALRRSERSDKAAFWAAAAAGQFIEASNRHAAARPVAEAVTSLAAVDASALGALARAADYCAAWAPPPSGDPDEGVARLEHSAHSYVAAAALAAIIAVCPHAAAGGLSAAAARWLAAAAAHGLPPQLPPARGIHYWPVAGLP